jgi:hypothetical protein
MDKGRKKSQMITYQAIKHLDKIKEKTEETKETVNPESTSVNEAPLTEKLELLRTNEDNGNRGTTFSRGMENVLYAFSTVIPSHLSNNI